MRFVAPLARRSAPKPTVSSWSWPLVRDLTTTRVAVGAEAHQLALVARARRAAGAAEVERLEQVRLAGAVGAVDDRQPWPEPRVRPA